MEIIGYFFREGDEIAFDYDLFGDAVRAFPEESMEYGFDRIRELADIDIFDSDDGNVRVYSWDYPQLGTMGSYGNLVQYRWRRKVKFDSFVHDRDEFEHATLGLYTLEEGKYIRYEYLREWSSQAYALARAFGLTKHGLRELPLFESGDGPTEMIDLEYNIPDWYFRAGRGEGYKWLFFYDDAEKTLYTPSIPEDNTLSDRYVPYRWNGETMHPLPENGNPFLRCWRSPRRLWRGW